MTDYTPTTEEIQEAWNRRYDGEHTSAPRAEREKYDAEFDRWLADVIRKAKDEARAEALTKARVHLDRIAPNGLISKADVLGDLEMWSRRATRGIQPNGNHYTEEP